MYEVNRKHKKMIECVTKNLHHGQNIKRLRNDSKTIDQKFHPQYHE